MFQNKDKIDRMHIASPCLVSWDKMTGNNRVRYCDRCSLHVYDFAEMTRDEITNLIGKTEGRFCARLYRRTDGTVITKDCPVGLRAIRRRVSRFAGATVTAVLSIFLTVVGRPAREDSRSAVLQVKTTGLNTGIRLQHNRAEISGRVLDQNGGAIPSAKVTILNQSTGKKSTVLTMEDGAFRLTMLAAGRYTIEIESPIFSQYKRTDIQLGASDTLNEDIVLFVAGTMMGIIVDVEPDMTYRGQASKTVFSERKIRSLPY